MIPLIISVAVSGARALKSQNPHVPYSPIEITDQIIAAANAGAAMAHVHTRGKHGEPTQSLDDYAEIIDRVRRRSDILIELSLGSPGLSLEQALEPLKLKPLIASFPMSARREKSEGDTVLIDTARTMLDNGTRPAFAYSTIAERDRVLSLIDGGLGGPVPCVTIASEMQQDGFGIADSLRRLREGLPVEAQWWVAKSGVRPADQFVARALAINAGAHVRVGFEDHLRRYGDDGDAPSNAWYVKRMTQLATSLGRAVATPEDARAILRLNDGSA